MLCVFAMHLRGKRDKWEILKVLLHFLPDTRITWRIWNEDYNAVSEYIQFTVSTVYHTFCADALPCCCIVLDVHLCLGTSQYQFIYASTDQYIHFVRNLKLFLWMLTGVYKMHTDIYDASKSLPKLNLQQIIRTQDCL